MIIKQKTKKIIYTNSAHTVINTMVAIIKRFCCLSNKFLKYGDVYSINSHITGDIKKPMLNNDHCLLFSYQSVVKYIRLNNKI